MYGFAGIRDAWCSDSGATGSQTFFTMMDTMNEIPVWYML